MLGSRALFSTENCCFASQEGGRHASLPSIEAEAWFCVERGAGHATPLQPHKTIGLRNVNLIYAVSGFCVAGGGRLTPLLPATRNYRFETGLWVVGFCHTEKRLLCHTADIFVVLQSRHVCCVTQHACLLCHTAEMSAVSHGRHVVRIPQDDFQQSDYFLGVLRTAR